MNKDKAVVLVSLYTAHQQVHVRGSRLAPNSSCQLRSGWRYNTGIIRSTFYFFQRMSWEHPLGFSHPIYYRHISHYHMSSPPPPRPPPPPKLETLDPFSSAVGVMGGLICIAAIALIIRHITLQRQKQLRGREAGTVTSSRAAMPTPDIETASGMKPLASGMKPPSFPASSIQKAKFVGAAKMLDEADFYGAADDLDEDEEDDDDMVAEPDGTAIAIEAAAEQHAIPSQLQMAALADEHDAMDAFEWPDGVKEWPPSPTGERNEVDAPKLSEEAPTPSLFFWPTPHRSNLFPATPAPQAAPLEPPSASDVAETHAEPPLQAASTPRKPTDSPGSSGDSPGTVLAALTDSDALLQEIRAEAAGTAGMATKAATATAALGPATPAAVRAARAMPLPESPRGDASASPAGHMAGATSTAADASGPHGALAGLALTTPKKTTASATYQGRQKRKPKRADGGGASARTAANATSTQRSCQSNSSPSQGDGVGAASKEEGSAAPHESAEAGPPEGSASDVPAAIGAVPAQKPFRATALRVDLEAVQQSAVGDAESGGAPPSLSSTARARQKPRPSKSARACASGKHSHRQPAAAGPPTMPPTQHQLHLATGADEAELEC